MSKKPKATFQKLSKEDMSLINKTVNDKRQNLIQAMKRYYQQVLTKKQADIFQKRFEEAIEKGVEIKDNYGLVQSKEELELEAMKNYIQLKFINADLISQLKDFKEVWGFDETKLEEYWHKWFVDGNQIE
jgi:hypothetical protein